MAEKTRLITASLINSIDWLSKCPPSWQLKAYNDLKNMLSGIWSDPTPEIKRGMDFEKKINQLLIFRDNPPGDSSSGFMDDLTSTEEWFLDRIPEGMQQQKVFKKYPEIDGRKYCIYCKTDLYKPGDLKDIKTTQSYKPGKYLETFQHILYMYAAEETSFEYLIATFDKETQKVTGVEMETCKAPPSDKVEYSIENTVFNRIREVEKFLLKYPELLELYNTKFCKY